MSAARVVSVACLTVLCSITLAGAVGAGAQQTGEDLILLRSPASVRLAGMNGVGAAMVGDAGAVFTNPAGIATVRHIALEGSYRATPFDGYMAFGALAWRVRQFDFGFGLQYFDRGVELARVLDSSTTIPAGSVPQSYELLGVGSLIYRYGMIAFGGSVKMARQQTLAVRRRGLGADAGLAIAIFDIMALGFSIQNIGGNLRDDSDLRLPRLSRFGFTMNYVDPQETLRLLSTFEVQWPDGEASRFVLGVEGGVVFSGVGVKGRFGYGTTTFAERTDFTYGASVDIAGMNLDYSFESDNLLGEPAHRFGLRLRL